MSGAASGVALERLRVEAAGHPFVGPAGELLDRDDALSGFLRDLTLVVDRLRAEASA